MRGGKREEERLGSRLRSKGRERERWKIEGEVMGLGRRKELAEREIEDEERGWSGGKVGRTTQEGK